MEPKRVKKRAVYKKDTFKLDDDQLDEWNMDKVYGDSVDSKGHSWSPRVRFPQGTEAALAEILDACPQYRSPADVIRSGTFHLLAYLKHKLENDIAFSGHATFIALRRAEDLKRDYDDQNEEDAIDELEDRLLKAKTRKNRTRVAECREAARLALAEIPSAPLFVERLEHIERDASAWLEATRK